MLTDVQIKKLITPTARREIPDGKITGLYLVLQPSGAKSWALRYRAAGKPAKLTLGPYPTLDLANARRRAQEALGEIARGKNPAAEKKAAREAQKAASSTADRVETVAASFIEKYVKRNVGESWAREAERLLTKEINPKARFQATRRGRRSRTFTTCLTRSSTAARRSSPIGPLPSSVVSVIGRSSVESLTRRHVTRSRRRPLRKVATAS